MKKMDKYMKKTLTILLMLFVIFSNALATRAVEAATVDAVYVTDTEKSVKGDKWVDTESVDLTKGMYLKLPPKEEVVAPVDGYVFDCAVVVMKDSVGNTFTDRPTSNKRYPFNSEPWFWYSISEITITFEWKAANIKYEFNDAGGYPEGFVWANVKPRDQYAEAGENFKDKVAQPFPDVIVEDSDNPGKWVFTWSSEDVDLDNPVMPNPAQIITITGSWEFYRLYEVEYVFEGENVPKTYTPEKPKIEKYYAGETVELSIDLESKEDKEYGNWHFTPWKPKKGETDIEVTDRKFTMPEGNVTIYGSWEFFPESFEFGYEIGPIKTYYKGSNEDLKGFRIIDKTNKTIIPEMLTLLYVEGPEGEYDLVKDVDYEVTTGSIVHDLKASFIEKKELKPGTYTIVAEFHDKTSDRIDFKVANKPSPSTPKPVIPKTGIE